MKKTLLSAAIAMTLTSPVMAVEVSDQLEVYGKMEVEYGAVRAGDEHQYGTYLDIAEFGTTIRPNEHFDIVTSWLYEEYIDDVETPLEIDEAYVNWHTLPDDKLNIIAGKQYLPFGDFETAMITDPLTLELGETRQDKALVVNGTHNNVTASAFGFKGEDKNGYGVAVNYNTERGNIGIDYQTHLQESEAAALTLHGTAKLGKTTLRAEHLTTLEALEDGSKPSASRIEANYDLNNNRTIAAQFQATKEAEALELAETVYGVAYRQPLYKDLTGALELQQAKAYDGEKTKVLTAQIAYEF